MTKPTKWIVNPANSDRHVHPASAITFSLISVLRPFNTFYVISGRASLIGSLPVLSAQSFASNWQLLFLNQRKRVNGHRIFSWPSLSKRMCQTWGSNSGPPAMPSRYSSVRATAPGPVRSASSLCALRVAKDPNHLQSDSENSDQTAQVCRLSVFSWALMSFVCFVMLWLIVHTHQNK